MREVNFKHTEIGLIPYDWEVKTLGKISTLINGRAFCQAELLNNGKYKVLRVGNFFSNDSWYYSDLELDEKLYCEIGDLLYAWSCTYGAYIWKEPKTIFHYHIWKVLPEDVEKKFLFYVLNNDTEKQRKASQGSTMSHITKGFMENRKFALPPTLAEQEKIANALSKIDQLINDLGALIEKKKVIKQGTMQDLLTAKRRLKGFTGEWTSKQIIEIVGKIKRGQSLQSKDYKKGDIPVVAGGKQYAGFHNVANHHGRTITISGSGANAGYVSFHANPIFATDCSVIDDKGNFDLLFIYYVLQQRQNDIYKLQSGGAQPHIYPKNIEDIVSIFPPTLAEQNAIANILSSMDTEITNLEQKRNKYIVIKQGMMQNLLTGKIRLI